LKGGEKMTNIKTRLTSVMVAGSFMAGVLMPGSAFAATNVTISGNAANSMQKSNVKVANKSKAKQKNSASLTNGVNVNQKTGGNKANQNNGGNVGLTTGAATSTVTLTNTTGGNVMVAPDCDCVDPDVTVSITDNGAGSSATSNVKYALKHKTVQNNSATIVNGVNVTQDTGSNQANQNNGGDVTGTSGVATSTVTVNNTTGDNVMGPAESE
jgi:hypothetical protein